jgi:hypothetical protein
VPSKHITDVKAEGRIEVSERRRRRRKQELYNLKEKRGSWKLKEEALDRFLCRTCLGGGCGLVVRQTAE